MHGHVLLRIYAYLCIGPSVAGRLHHVGMKGRAPVGTSRALKAYAH